MVFTVPLPPAGLVQVFDVVTNIAGDIAKGCSLQCGAFGRDFKFLTVPRKAGVCWVQSQSPAIPLGVGVTNDWCITITIEIRIVCFCKRDQFLMLKTVKKSQCAYQN